jgi:hypothetical protein
MTDKINEIRAEIDTLSKRSNLTYEGIKRLGELFGAEMALRSLEGKYEPNTSTTEAISQTKEYSEVFPALKLYQREHNSLNLKKLCVEITEFCNAVYASTRSSEERKIFFDAINNINR